jgi:hypothetical protein
MTHTKEMHMTTIKIVSTYVHDHQPAWIHDAAQGLCREMAALGKAMVSPGSLSGAVERMAALHEEARRIEASDPLQASRLRQQAAQIQVE